MRKDIIAAFIIGLVICISVESASALSIYNVRFEDVAKTSAVVKWETDQNSDSKVFYGPNRPPGQTAEDPALTRNHSVQLTGLLEDTKYYVNVLSRSGTQSAFDDNGTYSYTFMTSKEPAPEDIGLNISVPTSAAISEIKSAINTNRITISGVAQTGSTVRFYVNTERIPSQIIETGRYAIDVDATGYFAGTIQLYETVYQGITGLNNVTIAIFAPDGEKTAISRLVIVDTKAPRLYVDQVRSPRNDSNVLIKGSVDEDAEVALAYDSQQPQTLTLTDNAFETTINLGADGNHSINITATDLANNTAVKSIPVKVDRVAPSVQLEEKVFQEESRINIVTIKGKTSEPRCRIKIENLGDLTAITGYTNVSMIESERLRATIEETRRPGEPGTDLSVEYEVGILGAITGYEKEFTTDDDGGFDEDLAVAEGNNDLLFTITDEAGNAREVIKRIRYVPGSDFWLVNVVTTLPNEIYTDNLMAETSRGVQISVMYDILYYGPTDKEITMPHATAALDGQRFNNSFFSAGQSYEHWNKDTKRLQVMTYVTANKYSGKIEDLPDQLDFQLRTTISYRYGDISMSEDVYVRSAVAVEKPFDYTQFLSPEMINDTIDMLDDWINWTKDAMNVTEDILLGTTAACIAYQLYTYFAGPGDNQERLRTLYYLCDRVWCPTIPPDCGRLVYIADQNMYRSPQGDITVEWAKSGDSGRTCPGGYNRIRVSTTRNDTPALGIGGSNTIQLPATEYYCTNITESEFRAGDANIYSGIGCFPQNDGSLPPDFHNAKCWPADANKVNDGGKVNTYDDFISSVQCGCISGIHGHLGNLLRILEGFRNCLRQAYIGEVRGGYCERLFAQFVCDLISWLIEKALRRGGQGGIIADTGQETADLARGNFQEVSRRLQARYGGIATNRLGLDPRELVKKMCIAAITGDWSDLRNQIVQQARVPVAPVIGPMLPESRFTSWNPFTGKAGINYYLTLGILSGGQRVTGRLKIICDKSKENGNACPPGQEVVVHEYPVIVEADGSIETNYLYQDNDARYWANVARLELEYQVGAETLKPVYEEIIAHKGGMVLQCHVSLIPCCIQCETWTGDQFGTMEFRDAKTTPKNVRTYYPDNEVLIRADTQKIAPFGSTNDSAKPKVYLVYNLTKPGGNSVTNRNDKDKLKNWQIQFNNFETDVFPLLKFPAKGDLGTLGGYEWFGEHTSLRQQIALKTSSSLSVEASAQIQKPDGSYEWQPRAIKSMQLEDSNGRNINEISSRVITPLQPDTQVGDLQSSDVFNYAETPYHNFQGLKSESSLRDHIGDFVTFKLQDKDRKEFYFTAEKTESAKRLAQNLGEADSGYYADIVYYKAISPDTLLKNIADSSYVFINPDNIVPVQISEVEVEGTNVKITLKNADGSQQVLSKSISEKITDVWPQGKVISRDLDGFANYFKMDEYLEIGQTEIVKIVDKTDLANVNAAQYAELIFSGSSSMTISIIIPKTTKISELNRIGLWKQLLSVTRQQGQGLGSQFVFSTSADADIRKISYNVNAEQADIKFKLKFKWEGSEFEQEIAKIQTTFRELRGGGTAEYPLGSYELKLSLWFDKDGNEIIDSEDESVPFGNYDLQEKTVTFEFRASPDEQCTAEPKAEIIYPQRNWLVSKSLKYIDNKQGVDITLWDDCNQIDNVAVYDEKSYKLGQNQILQEPFESLALDIRRDVKDSKITIGGDLSNEKQQLFRYNDKENFNIIVRAIDKQGHKGGDEVLVKYSGEDGSTTELLNDAQCSNRGGQCLTACASSAAIVGTCTPDNGQARVCCTVPRTTTTTTVSR